MGQTVCQQCPNHQYHQQHQPQSKILLTYNPSNRLNNLAKMVGRSPILKIAFKAHNAPVKFLKIGAQGLLSGGRAAKDGLVLFGDGIVNDIIFEKFPNEEKFVIQYNEDENNFLYEDLGKGPGSFISKKVAILYNNQLIKVMDYIILVKITQTNKYMIKIMNQSNNWIECKQTMIGYLNKDKLQIGPKQSNKTRPLIRIQKKWRWIIISQQVLLRVYIENKIQLQKGMSIDYGNISLEVIQIQNY